MSNPNVTQTAATRKSLADKITDVVREYHNVKVDTADVDGLIRLRKNLAVLCFGFAREVGDLYQERNAAEFRRKAQFARLRKLGIDKGDSAAKAEAAAEADVEEARQEEMVSDGLWRASSLIYTAAKDVLDTLSQHIAAARYEKAREMTGQGSQST